MITTQHPPKSFSPQTYTTHKPSTPLTSSSFFTAPRFYVFTERSQTKDSHHHRTISLLKKFPQRTKRLPHPTAFYKQQPNFLPHTATFKDPTKRRYFIRHNRQASFPHAILHTTLRTNTFSMFATFLLVTLKYKKQSDHPDIANMTHPYA